MTLERQWFEARQNRFPELMALYAENYRQLNLLLDASMFHHERFVSRVTDAVDLYVEVLERHRYTTVVRMTYVLESEAGTFSLDPDAEIRIYHDASLAEALCCYPGRLLQPVSGAMIPAHTSASHRWRMNTFLDRWLEYLLDQGHSLATVSVADPQDWQSAAAALAQSSRGMNQTRKTDNAGLLDSI